MRKRTKTRPSHILGEFILFPRDSVAGRSGPVVENGCLRFVHLSDIHFGQSSGGELVMHEDARAEVLTDCAKMQRKLGNADGIIVTGDLAYAGKTEEYGSCGFWLDELTNVVGCDETDVFVIPGNHDVDFDRIKPILKMVHDRVRSATATDAVVVLESASADDESLILRPLESYVDFANRYGCHLPSASKPYWRKPFRFPGGQELILTGLTSVIVSNREDARGNLLLGKPQYILGRKANREYVVLLHHPLDWLKDRQSAKEYLHTRSRVLMFGHEHLASAEKIITESGLEIVALYAGATNPPDPGGEYTFHYNWLEFSLDERQSPPSLSIRTYPRRWGRSTQFEADHTRARLVEGRYLEFTVPCPNFSSAARGVPEDAATIPVCVEDGSDEDEIDMSEQARDFAKLRYMFWRYLSWQDRLQILVELELLPEQVTKPLPQTLERLSLDRAQSRGSLDLLWDAIMEKVPEDNREANPFADNNS